LRKVANRQTDRQTDKQRRKHDLLGGGNEHRRLSIVGCNSSHKTIGKTAYADRQVLKLAILDSSLRPGFYTQSVWNSLPNSVTTATSLISFKKQLKTFIFAKSFMEF